MSGLKQHLLVVCLFLVLVLLFTLPLVAGLDEGRDQQPRG